jgi:5-methylcytosine-specific restriction endonuclease McrA
MSFRIRDKYGWRCMACGIAAEDGAEIVTDHIFPVRHFWQHRLNPKNLQVLCGDCNEAKGNLDTTDFRPQWVRELAGSLIQPRNE